MSIANSLVFEKRGISVRSYKKDGTVEDECFVKYSSIETVQKVNIEVGNNSYLYEEMPIDKIVHYKYCYFNICLVSKERITVYGNIFKKRYFLKHKVTYQDYKKGIASFGDFIFRRDFIKNPHVKKFLESNDLEYLEKEKENLNEMRKKIIHGINS